MRASIVKRSVVVLAVLAACGGEDPWNDVNSQDQASVYGTPGLLDPDDVLYDSGESDEFEPELQDVPPQFVEPELCVQCIEYAMAHGLLWTEYCDIYCSGDGLCKPLLGGGMICNCGISSCPSGSGFITGATWDSCSLPTYRMCTAPTFLSK